MTVEEFLATDQANLGPAWRYDLVDGVPVAHAAPSPEHGAVAANLILALGNRLRRGAAPGCRVESATAAIPRSKSWNTARVPDVVVRCGGLPRVVIEVVSPSDARHPRLMDRRRRDLMDVEGVEEIVEVFPEDPLCRVYRRSGDLWAFSSIEGMDASLPLRSLDLALPLAEIYEGVLADEPGGQPEDGPGAPGS